MRTSWVAAGLAAFLAFGSAPAMAATNQLNGELFANACTSCHGLEGRSVGAAPVLAGQDYEALLAKLMAFRTATDGVTIMNRIVRGYSDEELAALARYFSTTSAK